MAYVDSDNTHRSCIGLSVILIGCTLTKDRPSVEWSYPSKCDEYHTLILRQVDLNLSTILNTTRTKPAHLTLRHSFLLFRNKIL